jgi:hydroxymethylbilane synthase
VSSARRAIFIATRGSALALAQANLILSACREAFPQLSFELSIIKTTGDKLQTASLALEGKKLPKGLFTKELEVALLDRRADLAVHSLKDLPTELPAGLKLGAVAEREDVRDVLIYRAAGSEHGLRGFGPALRVQELPRGTTVATSSTRRKAQLLAINPGLKIPEIRGNVLTRMQKLARQSELDATILALAGLTRLNYHVSRDGRLEGESVPDGLLATVLDTEVMLPCVGQGAIGIEVRENDETIEAICARLNHEPTHQCITAERAFLAAMGGGCQSPVAAHASLEAGQIKMRALSFVHGPLRRAEAQRPLGEPIELGQQLAALLNGEPRPAAPTETTGRDPLI